jgi:cytosine/adenosine deaminase-related metal-dependent hydrolase
MAMLLENATVVTLNPTKPVVRAQQILIEQGKIHRLGPRVEMGGLPITNRIDCSEMIVVPGMVNAHCHLTEILQKSFRDSARMEIWRTYRTTTEDLANLTAEEIGTAAELACSEMLKNGVTAAVDHFSTRPGLTVEKMQAILGAFERTGIRGMLVPSLRDQDSLRLANGTKGRNRIARLSREPWKDEVLAVLADLRHERSGIMLGPSSPMNCSDELLAEVVGTAEKYDLGIHTHLLETRLQAWTAQRLYKKTICAHLAEIGFLSSRVSAAHSIWVDDRDIDLLASSGASVVHNPASNLKLGSGIAPVATMKSRGVNVALGTDGGDTSDSYSIFEQMRLAAYLSRIGSADTKRWITALDAFTMATVNGAEAVPNWRGKIGRIKTGYAADLVLLKPGLRLRPLNDIVHQLVFCEAGQSVDTVLVGGEIVVQSGRLTRIDEDALVKRAEPISRRMYRLFRRLEKIKDPTRKIALGLYRKAMTAKGLPVRSLP